MDVIFCLEDRLWCSKEHSKLCFECLITVFGASKQLAPAEGWKKLPKLAFWWYKLRLNGTEEKCKTK